MRGTRVGRGRVATDVSVDHNGHKAKQIRGISRVLGTILAIAVSLASAATAVAQPAGVQPGAIERQYDENAPLKPTDKITIPSVDKPKAWGEAQSIKFVLKSVNIDGNTAIPDSELSRPFEPLLGKEVSFTQVFSAAEEVTRIYDAAGYAVSLAYVPAQEIRDGALLVRIVEGYVGEVKFSDPNAARNGPLNAYSQKLKASKPLTSAVLERYLLLANDLPGVRVKSMFERMPGGDPGAMRLLMQIDRKTVDATLDINNRGSKAIGPIRESVNVSINGVLGYDERISIFGVGALDGNELAYIGASIGMPVGGQGTVIAIEAARSETDPGTDALTAIDYEGEGWTGSANVTYPFLRSLDENLYLTGGVLYKSLKSRMLSTDNSHDRLTAIALGIDYDVVDHRGHFWHAVSTLFVGLPVLDATEEGDPLGSRMGASGEFVRLEASVSRFVQVSSNTSFYAELAGQIADGPLLVSEQCGYGGAHFGRAFDPFEITGDHCIKGRAEFRLDLASPLAALQLYAMGDFGVMIKSGSLLPGESRSENGESVGFGVRARAHKFLSGFAEVAVPLDRGVSFENGSRDPRFFFGLSASY